MLRVRHSFRFLAAATVLAVVLAPLHCCRFSALLEVSFHPAVVSSPCHGESSGVAEDSAALDKLVPADDVPSRSGPCQDHDCGSGACVSNIAAGDAPDAALLAGGTLLLSAIAIPVVRNNPPQSTNASIGNRGPPQRYVRPSELHILHRSLLI